jgi:hypothetical protein
VETIHSSKTLITTYKTIQHCKPEDHNRQECLVFQFSKFLPKS